MYIIAIGWLYVTVLMAITETSIVAGVLTFLFYGLFPVALLLWLLGTPVRRQRQRFRAAQEAAVQNGEMPDTPSGNEDPASPESNAPKSPP